MKIRSAFALALRRVRHKRQLTIDDFSLVAARSYMGLLERGGTSPTLDKIDVLCERADLHPATLIALTYAIRDGVSVELVLSQMAAEVQSLTLDQDAAQPQRRAKRSTSPR